VTKIVVAVKYVPDATADRTFDADNTVDRENVDGLLSELDEYAVEQALQVVEAGDGEVTVLTVGPAEASDAVRKALQMGADAGVHVVPVDGQVIGEVPVASGVGHVLHSDNDPQAHAGSPTASSFLGCLLMGSIGA